MNSHIEHNDDFRDQEENLNLYLDGELPLEKQSDLYGHLADNRESRAYMDNVMLFRRMSRQEHISPPQVADDRFFERLALLKESNEKYDRFEDREPLWNAKRPVSVRAAIAAVVAVFLVGLLLPITNTSGMTTFLDQEEERVFFESPDTKVLQSYIYVFEPGILIEAEQH